MLDEKDLKILFELRRDSRQTTQALSRILDIPRSTIHERIKKMVQNGYIKQFTVIPDYKKIGLPITAFIHVSFLPNPEISQRILAEKISKLEGVHEVHIVSGEWDLILKVRAKSVEDVGKLVVDRLRKIRGVGKTQTSIVFSTVKEVV